LDWLAGLIDRLVVLVGVALLGRLWLGSPWVREAPTEILGLQYEVFGLVEGASHTYYVTENITR